jgi:hypothetical protein
MYNAAHHSRWSSCSTELFTYPPPSIQTTAGRTPSPGNVRNSRTTVLTGMSSNSTSGTGRVARFGSVEQELPLPPLGSATPARLVQLQPSTPNALTHYAASRTGSAPSAVASLLRLQRRHHVDPPRPCDRPSTGSLSGLVYAPRRRDLVSMTSATLLPCAGSSLTTAPASTRPHERVVNLFGSRQPYERGGITPPTPCSPSCRAGTSNYVDPISPSAASKKESLMRSA